MYTSATITRVIQIRTFDMGGTYSLHVVMKKEYINTGIGKQEIRRTLRALVAVRKTPKNVCFLNPLNAELNPICHLLALLGAHRIFHVSRLRVKERGYTNFGDFVVGWCESGIESCGSATREFVDKKNLLDGIGQPYLHILACHYFS